MIKECFKCGETKDLDGFYKHPGTADGHLGKCKECTRADVAQHRADNIDAIREYDRERAKTPERIAHLTRNTRKWRKENPDGYKAHIDLNNAVRADNVFPPFHCQGCGEKRKLHAHHEDYFKPLEIKWLCPICHAKRK